MTLGVWGEEIQIEKSKKHESEVILSTEETWNAKIISIFGIGFK